MAGISVKIDLSGVKKKISQQAFDRGQYMMANKMLSDMNENFVPERDGNLRQSGQVSADGKQLVWNSVYARRHYYAPGNWKYTTPGTGPRWDEKAKGIFMSTWIDTFMKGAGF